MISLWIRIESYIVRADVKACSIPVSLVIQQTVLVSTIHRFKEVYPDWHDGSLGVIVLEEGIKLTAYRPRGQRLEGRLWLLEFVGGVFFSQLKGPNFLLEVTAR